MGKTKKVLPKELKRAIRLVMIWVVVFIFGLAVVGGVLYTGITGVPSSATYLTNFNDLDTTKLWDNFKTSQPQLDPSLLESSALVSSGVWVNVSAMGLGEELFQPKTVISFHVSISTVLGYSSLKLPSLLVFLLDQNDRIRGKLYAQQSSPDFFVAGQNKTDYTFWFRVPSDMQNHEISIIVELFGIVDYSSSINYQNLYSNANDAVYGSLPSWQYPQSGSYFRLWSYDRIKTHTPVVYSVISMASYSWVLAGVISTMLSVPIWLRNRSEDWWKRNKIHVIFGMLFLFTYFVVLLLVGLIM